MLVGTLLEVSGYRRNLVDWCPHKDLALEYQLGKPRILPCELNLSLPPSLLEPPPLYLIVNTYLTDLLTTRLHPQRQSMICELLFPTSILAVKMNRKTLVIVLETEIYIYDISNMRLLHVIETTSNPEGTSSLA